MISAQHPCFSCRLPDCDDGHERCALRRALRDYNWFLRRKAAVPVEVRERKNIAYNELYGENHRARSRAATAKRRQEREVSHV